MARKGSGCDSVCTRRSHLLLFLCVCLFSSSVLVMADSTGAAEEGKTSSSPGLSRPKREWPDLVGMDGDGAKSIIAKDHPGADVVLVPANQMVTMDFKPNRVRVFVDPVSGRVAKKPVFG